MALVLLAGEADFIIFRDHFTRTEYVIFSIIAKSSVSVSLGIVHSISPLSRAGAYSCGKTLNTR
jgi:hypothetical protein